MKKSIRILTFALSLILSVMLVACSGTGDATTPESTAPVTPSESTPVNGTPDASTPEASNTEANSPDISTPTESTTEETPDEPLPEKTAEELYNTIKSFLAGLGNRNFKVTVGMTTDGTDPMTMTEGKSVNEQTYVVAINGYRTDDFAMYLERTNYMSMIPTEGEKQERSAKMVATVIGGIGYVAEISEDHLRKIKTPVDFEAAMAEINGIPDSLYRYDFSDFIDAKCETEGNNYILTLTGLTEQKFESELYGDSAVSKSNQYTYDNTKDFSMTVVFDRNGNMVSTDISISYAVDYKDADGVAVKYTAKQTGKVEFYSEAAVIALPADADEYIENTQTPDKPKEPANAEELYSLVREYFSKYYDEDQSFSHHCDQITVNDDGTTDHREYDEIVRVSDFGKDSVKVFFEHAEGENCDRFIYDGEHLYNYAMHDGEEYKIKVNLETDLINEEIESNFMYELPFIFSEFLSAEMSYDGENYILEVFGVTEEAYVREILDLNMESNVALDLARQFYDFNNEDYREKYVISPEGEIVSVETYVSYSFEVKEDMPEYGLEKASWSYEERHSIARAPMSEIKAPEDADTYTE